MRQPRLLFAVQVTIEAIDVPGTVFDDDARSIVRSPKRTSYIIPAQIRFRSLSEPGYGASGLEEDVEGWLTVRPIDLELKSYVPKNGDRIVKIGASEVGHYYLRNVQPMGHYTVTNGQSLQRLYFEDRRPAATKPSFTRTT